MPTNFAKIMCFDSIIDNFGLCTFSIVHRSIKGHSDTRLIMDSRPINYAASFIACNFLLAHVIFSDRVFKLIYKLDHNVAPRQDLDKYGTAAVKQGKISQGTLAMLRRSEAAHQNAMDHLPFFFVTMVSHSLVTASQDIEGGQG